MADDAIDDVGVSEVTPEDFMADEQDKATADPSPAKEGKPAVEEEAKPDPIPEEDLTDKAEEPEKEPEPETPEKSEDPENPDEVVETEKPLTKADERKAQLNTEIRDLVAQRNTLKAEVEKANQEVYQVATEEELEEQGMSSLEAKVEAMRQRQEINEFNNTVVDAQLTLSSDSNRVLKDFPVFDASSSEYDEDLAAGAARLLEANLIKDPNSGQVIGTNMPIYDLYETLANASGNSAVKGQLKGQAEAEKMLANVDSGATTSPPKKVIDPVLALWSEDD